MLRNASSLISTTLVVLMLVLCGCGGGDDHDPDHDHDKKTTEKDTESSEKDEWWCIEHGIPEHLCGMCVKEHADKCKAKGDWCEHDKPGSNCFVCNPDMQEKYAVMYRNKYGKEPPPIEDEEGEEKGGEGDEKK